MSELPATKNRHWIEYVATAAALIVSAVSLWVAIGTEDANRKMVAASSWPFLQVQIDNALPDGQPYLKYNVLNLGVGPAKIESFELFWKRRPMRTVTQLMAQCCGLKPNGGPVLSSDKHTRLLSGAVQGIVLRPGDTEAFIMYPLREDNVKIWNALNAARKQITYRICYCSVFDECWSSVQDGHLSSPGHLHPERVSSCPVPKVAYTE